MKALQADLLLREGELYIGRDVQFPAQLAVVPGLCVVVAELRLALRAR